MTVSSVTLGFHCGEMGHVCATLAFKPRPASLAPADMRPVKSSLHCTFCPITRKTYKGKKPKKKGNMVSVKRCGTACMYLLEYVYLHSIKAVQMMPPTADEDTYLTTTRKMEKKKKKT